MLIAVFTYLSQLNSLRTVTHFLFMVHFNNIFVFNINRPIALPIVFNNKISSIHFLATPSHNSTININVSNEGVSNKYTD